MDLGTWPKSRNKWNFTEYVSLFSILDVITYNYHDILHE